MMKRTILRVYRRVTPPSLRSRLRRVPLLRRAYERWFLRDSSLHDEYYDAAYYEGNASIGWAPRAAAAFAPMLIGELHPSSVLDLGCGTGEFVRAFGDLGVKARGVDFSVAAVEKCTRSGLEVKRADLSQPDSVGWRADLTLCFEVAEHLVPEVADVFVNNLCGAAERALVITAAGPGQEGTNHFNCRPKAYWIGKIERQGWAFDGALTDRLEGLARDRALAPWFRHNMMAFRKDGDTR